VWLVKSTGDGRAGPGPNVFSDAASNVFVGAEGRLHLRITQVREQWRCAEVRLAASLGYGRYAVTLASPIHALDPQVVLGLFTYDHDDAADHHREIDIEFSRWGDADEQRAAQFVMQPAEGDSVVRVEVGDQAPSEQSFTWTRRSVTFAASNTTPPTATYSGAKVPSAGTETFTINLWLYGGKPPQNGEGVEVVIDRFAFTPASEL